MRSESAVARGNGPRLVDQSGKLDLAAAWGRRYGDGPASEALYPALRLPARTTLPHFSVSSAISLPQSAGEPGSGHAPMSASCPLSFGSASPALISRLSLSTISAGVPLGAHTPFHVLAS